MLVMILNGPWMYSCTIRLYGTLLSGFNLEICLRGGEQMQNLEE